VDLRNFLNGWLKYLFVGGVDAVTHRSGTNPFSVDEGTVVDLVETKFLQERVAIESEILHVVD
jgi:hypothetical protein